MLIELTVVINGLLRLRQLAETKQTVYPFPNLLTVIAGTK